MHGQQNIKFLGEKLFLNKPIFAQLLKKNDHPIQICGTRSEITVFENALSWSFPTPKTVYVFIIYIGLFSIQIFAYATPGTINSHHNLPCNFCKIYFNIILTFFRFTLSNHIIPSLIS
jgi:hypothetical protein